jgi:acyl transferase domain-containing protein
VDITVETFNKRPSIGAFIKSLRKNYRQQFFNYYKKAQIPAPSARLTHNLADIAYTLQIGREEMEERLAVVVSTVSQLKEKLDTYCRGKNNMENFYSGNINNAGGQSLLLMEGEEKEAFIRTIIKNRKLDKLGYCWVMGVDIDWKLLCPDGRPRRISLPQYPFERKKYWLSPRNQQQKQTNEKNT